MNMIQQVGINQGRFWEAAPKRKPESSNFLELFQVEQAKGMTARQYLSTLKGGYTAAPPEALWGQGDNNPSIWDELSKKYDIHHATFDELCTISYQLYQAKQITLIDHATLSFDPTRIPHGPDAKFYFTPADQDGRRDWIAEYTARAEFELKNGNPDGYQYILNHFVRGILSRLERK